MYLVLPPVAQMAEKMKRGSHLRQKITVLHRKMCRSHLRIRLRQLFKTSEESGKGKTLVVYYSATNNTKEVAGYIAAATDGELFEIVPTEPYSSDDLNWSDSDSRVSKEHDDPSLRKVELENAVPENWKDYDTVFIGFPIWWGIAAWPVDGFISANDFSGKTVIPFCTSSSSGLGESGEQLEKAAGTGDWLDGKRFQSGASEETVQDWVNGLGLK